MAKERKTEIESFGRKRGTVTETKRERVVERGKLNLLIDDLARRVC